jgi:hypothetical protein
MTEDKDAEVAERIRYECCGGDIEAAHGRADDIIVSLLRELGYVKTANAWEDVEKWYA